VLGGKRKPRYSDKRCSDSTAKAVQAACGGTAKNSRNNSCGEHCAKAQREQREALQ